MSEGGPPVPYSPEDEELSVAMAVASKRAAAQVAELMARDDLYLPKLRRLYTAALTCTLDKEGWNCRLDGSDRDVWSRVEWCAERAGVEPSTVWAMVDARPYSFHRRHPDRVRHDGDRRRAMMALAEAYERVAGDLDVDVDAVMGELA